MRFAYRIVIAALLLTTFFFFNEYLDVVPTQDRLNDYVKSLTNHGDEAFAESSTCNSHALSTAVTSIVTDEPESPTTTTTPLATSTKARGMLHAIFTQVLAVPTPPPEGVGDKVVVIGKIRGEDTDWVAEKLPDWQHAIYSVDNIIALLHTPRNKGNEANPYLLYIIENYDNLPSTMAFIHPHEAGWPKSWHTDFDGYSNAASLRALNLDFVQRNGYANLRCNGSPGCPDEIQPLRESFDEKHPSTENAYTEAWKAIFGPQEKVPEVVGAACCAQFAVSRDQVLKRPKTFYENAHQWLMNTTLDDATSGRVFEYMWHIIFGQEAVYCPPLDQCYSDVYQKDLSWW